MDRLAFLGSLRQVFLDPMQSLTIFEVTLHLMDLQWQSWTKKMTSAESESVESITSSVDPRESRFIKRMHISLDCLSAVQNWIWCVTVIGGLNSLNHLKKYKQDLTRVRGKENSSEMVF